MDGFFQLSIKEIADSRVSCDVIDSGGSQLEIDSSACSRRGTFHLPNRMQINLNEEFSLL